MPTIRFTPAATELFKQQHLQDKVLVLIADDGGGKYSLQGGACTIGAVFTLVALDEPDPDYPIQLTNEAGVQLYSAEYDLYFLAPGLVLDVHNFQFAIRDDAQQFETPVQVVNGAEMLAAHDRGLTESPKSC